ncbi:MAG: MerR family DNA-binding transcriptional regulator [Promethearchaeota archaeon]
MLVRVVIAAKLLGVCVKTLYRWEASGKLLPSFRTFGGHRRYESLDLLKLRGTTVEEGKKSSEGDVSDVKTERVVGYIRVSSAKQKDVKCQYHQVEDYAMNIYGSGMQFTKILPPVPTINALVLNASLMLVQPVTLIELLSLTTTV